MLLYALHDALLKPMPSSPGIPPAPRARTMIGWRNSGRTIGESRRLPGRTAPDPERRRAIGMYVWDGVSVLHLARLGGPMLSDSNATSMLTNSDVRNVLKEGLKYLPALEAGCPRLPHNRGLSSGPGVSYRIHEMMPMQE
jgi:hypothetical protein